MNGLDTHALIRHWEAIVAWKGGAPIQSRPTERHDWRDDPDPQFVYEFEYRAKPSRQKKTVWFNIYGDDCYRIAHETRDDADKSARVHLERTACVSVVIPWTEGEGL